MIDFHSHILPLMDDGSKSVEESLKLLKELSLQGVKKVAATPHFYAEREPVDNFLKRRSEAFDKLKSDLIADLPEILLGAEIRYYQGLSKLEGLKELQLLNSGILLIEMPFSHWTEYTVNEIINIASNGDITVALAHIERYMRFRNKKSISVLQNAGVLIQANAEYFVSPLTSRKALRLLGDGFIQLIGTDCHNTTSRCPNMDKAAFKIAKRFGDEFLEFINDYQTKLLDNQ